MHEYVIWTHEYLEQAYDELRQLGLETRQEDKEKPLLFTPGQMAWLEDWCRRKGSNPNLQMQFVAPTMGFKLFPTTHI